MSRGGAAARTPSPTYGDTWSAPKKVELPGGGSGGGKDDTTATGDNSGSGWEGSGGPPEISAQQQMAYYNMMMTPFAMQQAAVAAATMAGHAAQMGGKLDPTFFQNMMMGMQPDVAVAAAQAAMIVTQQP